MRFTSLHAVAAIAATLAFAANDIWRARSDGLSVDLLHWFSRIVPIGSSSSALPATDRTVVIGIDEETYRDDDFKYTPQALWTPQIATVLTAVLDGGAKVIGLDMVFSQSASARDEFANYDRDFLQALAKGAAGGRIVLSYTQQARQPIYPYRAQIRAVGGTDSLRPTNMRDDADGIIRSLPLRFQEAAADGRRRDIPGLPLEVYARAIGKKIAFAGSGDGTGTVNLGGAPLPGLTGDSFLLNFKPVDRDPPLYSFADLYACAQSGNAAYFRDHFAGKTVIFGAVLDTEDRRLTSKRLATNPMGGNYQTRCIRPVRQDVLDDHASKFIPGAYILATAIDNLKQGNWLRPAGDGLRLFCLGLLALTTAMLAVYRPFLQAAGGVVLLGGAWILAAILAFSGNVVLPLIAGLAAMAMTLPASLVYRVALIDRRRRHLKRSFSLYLPAAEVQRLVSGNRAPALGGELRNVTILFSDIAGYSKLSESLTPADLVHDLNAYFGRMTEIVQQHGGFVDKFIGDGILAVFGAPIRTGNHALDAARAAMEMTTACATETHLTLNGQPFQIRVGLHTGEAIVGNIGAPNRFNYTVVGDSVNLASRLEGVGKRYHTSIILSEQTREMIGDAVAFRELDQVRVVGRDQPVRLFTPLDETARQHFDDDAWMAALDTWRRGDFAQAQDLCTRIAAAGDEIAATFAERAAGYRLTPPAQWDGIVNLSEK